jgi:hypothetical protein
MKQSLFIVAIGAAFVTVGCTDLASDAFLAMEPTPGALRPPINSVEPVTGPGMFNSDNKPIITRSGLGSDPNNPSGTPGRST